MPKEIPLSECFWPDKDGNMLPITEAFAKLGGKVTSVIAYEPGDEPSPQLKEFLAHTDQSKEPVKQYSVKFDPVTSKITEVKPE